MKMSTCLGGCASLVSTALALLALRWWLTAPVPLPLAPRVPLPPPAATNAARDPLSFPRTGHQTFRPAPPPDAGAPWPSFRGPGRDNISREPVRLRIDWGTNGPPVLWDVKLGEGHAGPAVLNGRVYVLDHDEKTASDTLRCFSLADGAEIWRTWYRARAKRNHGISRTVPAVTDRHVLTMGPLGHVMCADTETGAFRWGIDLVARYETTVPLWYTAQCPLIDGNLAILAPAGKALLIAVDCETGQVAWETPNPRGWKMSHASVMPMTFDGIRAYVYCALGGVVAVAAEGEHRGRILWETGDWNHAVVAPSAVSLGGGRVFVTAGYGVGSLLLQAAPSNGTWAAKSVYRLDRTVFACEQQTPIYHAGHLFGVLPGDAGARNRELACLRPDGTLAWTSGGSHRFGIGPLLIADEKILVLKDDGLLTIAEARTDRYVERARARVLSGRDAWAPMALSGGRLLLRDSQRMICLDLRENGAVGGKP